jgi:hypothetical protein
MVINAEDPTWNAQSAADEERDSARRGPSPASAGKICRIRIVM